MLGRMWEAKVIVFGSPTSSPKVYFYVSIMLVNFVLFDKKIFLKEMFETNWVDDNSNKFYFGNPA